MSDGVVRGEDLLAAGQLGAQRAQGAGRGPAVEVGDQADGVRQRRRLGERRSTLVVDEQEGAALGRVLQRQSGDQRLQEFGLPRSGGAGDEGVRALPAQVDLHGALGRASQRGDQPIAGAASTTRRAGRRVRAEAGAGQVEQPDWRGATCPRRPGRGRPGRGRTPPPSAWQPVDADVRRSAAALPAEHRDVAGLPGEAEDRADRHRHVLDGVRCGDTTTPASRAALSVAVTRASSSRSTTTTSQPASDAVAGPSARGPATAAAAPPAGSARR